MDDRKCAIHSSAVCEFESKWIASAMLRVMSDKESRRQEKLTEQTQKRIQWKQTDALDTDRKLEVRRTESEQKRPKRPKNLILIN